jgi:uncharacterized protein
MDQVLRDFIVALRGSGLRVSVVESIDAMNTAKLVGYSDRHVLRDSLGAVLAKSQWEKEKYEECFDLYFSSPFTKLASDSSRSLPSEVWEGASSLSEMLLSGDAAGLSASMREAAREVGVNTMHSLTQRGHYVAAVLRHMGIQALRREIKQLYDEGTAASRARAEKLEAAEEQLAQSVRRHVEQQFALFSPASKEELLERYYRNLELSSLERRDLHHMHTIVQRMVKRLNDVHSRRRKAFRRGQLDFRKTLRSNITCEGLLFDLQWKRKKIDRPDVVALCDVSNSVSAVARFLLLFLYSLNKRLARIRTFTFCANLVEVSDVFDEYSVEEALVKLQSGVGLGLVMGPTDYGQALRDFEEGWSDIVTHKTTVLILGDARNNFTDPETGILKSIHDRSKRLIWLNPEPPSSWGSGDSEMRRYIPYCHLARECNTVTHLERVVDSLLDRD